MRYTLIINSHRDGVPAHRALQFARAVTGAGHQLQQVFFYAGGVETASDNHALEAWSLVSQQSDVECILCSASADRLGIDKPPQGFAIAGLGALIEAGVDSDRVISFG